MKPFVPIFCAALLGLGLSTQAPAAQDASNPTNGVQSFEFLNGWRMEDGGHMAAVRIQLDEGWKTYWRAPGSFGIPARFDWTGSKNVASVRFHWPTPHIYNEAGLITIGYKDELVLPIEFTPVSGSKKMVVAADVEFGVCADVCVPASAKFEAILPATSEIGDKDDTLAIRASLKNRPTPSLSAGVRNIACSVTPEPGGFHLVARFETARTLSKSAMTVVEYPSEDLWIEGSGTSNTGRNVSVSAMLFTVAETPIILDRSKIRLTLFNGGTAIDIQGCPAR
jgi:DsbC/DsbD-like thiol-disulfide interchange protein